MTIKHNPWFLAIIAMTYLSGCEADTSIVSSSDTDTDTDADADTDADTDSDADTDTDTDTDPDTDECADNDPAKYIYLIDRDDGNIYRFDPEFSTIELVGPLSCPGTGTTTPGSMSVTRDGTAYVQYSDARVYELNVFTASDCVYTGFDSSTTSFGKFGMGFVRDVGATSDTLYVANATHLASLDVDTWTGEMVGAVASQSELTGNALGEVWGFFPLESPPKIMHLDRDDGSTLESYSLPATFFDNVDTFAFAFWGGAFYVFVRNYGMGSTTDIYKADETGIGEFMMDTGRTIVGAGVSTCAPVVPIE